MITSNLKLKSIQAKDEKRNIALKVDDLIQLNQNKANFENSQCIKWIYDGENSYFLGYN